MASTSTAVERAIAMVNQSREMRERMLTKRREYQKKADKILAHQPYVLKRAMSEQLSFNLD